MKTKNISLTEIKALVKKMKRFDSQWAANLVPKIKEHKPNSTIDTIYTITGGTKKSQEWRMLFLEIATAHLEVLKEQYASKKAIILEKS